MGTTTRSSYATRDLVADAVRNKLRGLNALSLAGVVTVLSNLPAGGYGSTVKVPMDVAIGRFKARSEGSAIAATDLGDVFQTMTVDQASLGYKISGGAQRASQNDPWVKADESFAQAALAHINDAAAAAIAASSDVIALTATPTATVTEDQLDDLRFAFGDESAGGVAFVGHSSHEKQIAKLKDTTGARVFRPATEGGQILVSGKPMIGSDAVPQYFEAGNKTFATGGGTTVNADMTVSGSLSRHVKKILYVKISVAGTGVAASFQWALALEGATPSYSASSAVAAAVALEGTDLVLNFNLARTYSVNDTWTCLPSADIMFARRGAVLYSFNGNISVRETEQGDTDIDEYWTHIYFACAALKRVEMSDMNGIVRLRTKL